MKRHLVLSLALLALAAMLSSCGRSGSVGSPTAGNTSTTDQAEVASVLAENPEMLNEDVFTSSEETQANDSRGFAAIRPLRFGRVITNVRTNFDFAFSDPDSNGHPQRALVTVNRHLTGSLNILAGVADSADTSRQLIRKPLDDRWVRKLVLARRRVNEDSTRARWRLVGTSGVEITSANATSQITSLRIQAGDLDTTITDPLELFRLRAITRIDAGTPVTLTATTGRNDDIVLLYRIGMRLPFVNNGDGTYTMMWTTSHFGGLRHFGVNALSHGTLFDDAAPYDSKGWVLPFAVQADCDVESMAR